ncbi:MAG: ABC transporter ATP-binding protein [bacterium]
MAKKNSTIINLKHIHKTYFGAIDTPVLFDVNLEIAKGGIYAIIGQSGSGKSTLLNIIGTLDQATAGEISLDGIATGTMNKKQLAELRNQKIGFVFQYHYLLENFTVYENVVMPHLLSGAKLNAKTKKWASDLLKLVDITETAEKKPFQISGGQRQRAAIARALMNKPELILADEPTGNLDSINTKKVFALFRQINKELGTTFVIITHDENIAKQADSIIKIQDGRVTKI